MSERIIGMGMLERHDREVDREMGLREAAPVSSNRLATIEYTEAVNHRTRYRRARRDLYRHPECLRESF